MALTDNLVSYYKMEGNSNDSVGSNNGTDTSITYSAGNGKIGQGAGFNGSSSYIIAPFLNLSQGSVSFWVNFTSLSTSPDIIVSNQNTDGSDTYTQLNVGSNGSMNWYSAVNELDHVTSAGVITTGVWYNIIFTYDGTTIKCYVNDVEKSLTNSTSGIYWLTTGNQTVIGALKRGSQLYSATNGKIDEGGIWSRALSAAEITELYNGGAGLTYPFVSNQANFLAFF